MVQGEATNKKDSKTTSKKNGGKNTPFIGGMIVQKKLSIGASDDAYEKEADRVADTVVGMGPVHTDNSIQKKGLIQRKCTDCEEETLQQKGVGTEGGVASQSLSQQISDSKGSGHKMDSSTLNFMESRFGNDFSQVSIHTDQRSIQMNRELNAQAFTVGNDIYFNQGKYNPGTSSGKHLLAHELTHTIQQGKGRRINRSVISPAAGDAGTLPEEEIQKKSDGPQIQMMRARNQSGGADHISGNVAPWLRQGFTDPTGDKHHAYTDAGSRVTAWTAINYSSEALRYWCHGHTLGTYKNWFYSVFSSGDMSKAVADEYNPVSEANVRSKDIAVWTPSFKHSCIVEDPIHSGGALDYGATTVSTKNGRNPLDNSATLAATRATYIRAGLGPTVSFYRHK